MVDGIRDPRAIRLIAVVGMAGPTVFVIGIVLAAALTPGYSHLSEPVSQLAAFGRPHPAIQMTGFVVFGLSMVAVAFGLWRTLPTGIASRVGTILVGVGGSNMVATGLFRADPMDQRVPSVAGNVHMATAMVLFVSLILAFIVLGRGMRQRSRWAPLAPFSLVAGVSAFAFLAAFSFAFELQPEWVGLWQRLLAATIVSWFVTVSWRLRRLASHEDRPRPAGERTEAAS